MPVVGAAIGGLLGIGGGFSLGGIGAALLKVAAGLGLSYAARALAGKPDDLLGTGSTPTGVQATANAGDSQARRFIVGRFATPGQIVFMRAWGETNKTPHAYLVQVIKLSDLPIDRVVDVFVDGSKVTWNDGTGNRGYAPNQYRKNGVDYLWIKVHKGDQGSADDYLSSKFPTGTRDWGANHIGRGCAYAIVTSRWSEKLFSGNRPECLFVVDGLKMYDVTKDGSAGGSGLHRWNDPATWEHTTNPMVIVYNLMRGVRLPLKTAAGAWSLKWMYGLQTVNAAQLPFSSWSAAIAECNLIVTNRDGSTNAQYRAGAEISFDTEVGAEIDEFLKTCNGKIADCGGIYKPKVGPDVASGASVFSFTDDSLIITDQHEFNMFPSLDQVINGVDATFIAPGDAWQEKALPPRRKDPYIQQDDNRENIADISYRHVYDKSQGQRLSTAILNESRRFRRHVIVLPPEAYALEPLDFVDWTSARNGYSAKLFRVESIADRANGDQVVGIQEVDPTDYDWSASDEVVMPDGEQIIDRPPPQAIQSFTAIGATSTGADNRALPAIRTAWVGTDLDDIDIVKFEVRRFGTTTVIAQPDTSFPERGGYDIVQGINGDTQYEVRAAFQDLGRARDFDWTAWLPVTTPDTKIVADQIVTSLLTLINAGSASGKVITEQVLPAPAGFQTLYRITVYGTGPTPVAAGLYVYVSSTGVPGVIIDAANFAVGSLTNVGKDTSKLNTFPFTVDSRGITRLKRAHIEKLQSDQIDAGAIKAINVYAGSVETDKLTVNNIQLNQISTRHLSGSNVSWTAGKATCKVPKKGGVILVGTFFYDVNKGEKLEVAITKSGSNTPISDQKWKLQPGDDLKGTGQVITISDQTGTNQVYDLKRISGDGFLDNMRLVALRVAQ